MKTRGGGAGHLFSYTMAGASRREKRASGKIWLADENG